MIKTASCIKAIFASAVGVALLASSSEAQNATTNYSPGQLLLGFRQTAGSNSGNDLLTNLGNVSVFDSLAATHAGAVIDVTTGNYISGGSGASGINGIGNLGADLVSLWGASWATVLDAGSSSWNNGHPSVLWGAIGTNGTTVYVTNSSTTPFTPSSAGSQNGVKSAVDTLGSNSYDFNQSTANSNFNIIESGTSGTWQGNMFRVGNNNADFTIYPSSTSPATNQSMEAPQGITMYLDKEVAGAANGTPVGFFTLTNSGGLTYTVVAAVPEPGTWALLAAGGMFLIALAAKKRRFRSV